jgi:hypothetical protein
MSATFNVFSKITGVLNGERFTSGELHNPATITTSADIVVEKVVTVAAGPTPLSSTLILEIGDEDGADMTSAKAILITSTVAGRVSWGDEAGNNNSTEIIASVPFMIPAGTLTNYNAVTATRGLDSLVTTPDIFFYFSNDTASAGKVKIFAIG